MARVACAYIHRFELAVCAAGVPADEPVAIADLATAKAQLQAVNGAAERSGLHPGLTAARALALCPGLRIIAPDREALRRAEARLLKAMDALSPGLDADGMGAFFVAAQGLENIHADESVLARRLRQTAQALGFDARIGVADGTLAAWVAARRSPGITCIPPGEDAKALAEVPLYELGLPRPVLDKLELLGLTSVGELRGLPPGTLAQRLPEEGARLERICRGEERIAWPGRAQPQPDALEVSLELDAPTDDLEPLLFTMKSLVDRLLSRIAPLRRALAELLVVARLDDRTEAEHRLVPARPTLDSRTVMDLVRLWLSSGPYPGGILALKLVASKLEVATPRQVSLLGQKQEETARALELAVNRLTAAFGERNVVRAELVDTYRPEERVRWVPFTTPASPPVSPPSPAVAAPLALRLLSPPVPITAWSGQQLTIKDLPSVRVAAIEGPHRLSGDWWGTPYDRSYFWVTGVRGERLWVFRDETEGRFYLHAVAD